MAEPAFDHFFSTWFNVRFTDHDRGLDLDWLAHRFRLFEDFCYPSMRAQTEQDFRWLVFFDPRTPEPFRERIERFAEWPCFRPVFVDYWTYDVMREEMRALRTPGATHLITTRLDNDDALARDYVERLHALFRGQAFEFVNFEEGLVWHDGRVYAQRHRSSSFANLIERVDPLDPEQPRTVLSIDHMSIAGSGAVKQVRGAPAWMLVVHDRNLMNRVSGIRCSADALSGFALGPGAVPASDSALARSAERWAGLARAGAGRLLWRLRGGGEDRLIGR